VALFRKFCIKRFILLAVVGFALALLACGSSRVNPDNFVKIETGMTQAQVTALLGQPTESSSVDIAGFSGTTSTWKSRDLTITVQFMNGKVVAKKFLKTAQ
jgi:hypothetical protein